MGFCHGLQTSMGCGSTSSICVQTYNGTGANETKNYSVGKLIPNKNPYSTIKGNTGNLLYKLVTSLFIVKNN